jgi:hypothetical protein
MLPDGPTRLLAVGDRSPDSFTAQDAPADSVALPADALVRLAAVPTTSTLAEGRFADGTPTTRPVISTVAVGGRIATAIHLPPRQQLKTGMEDPSRLRATFVALVMACHDAGQSTSVSDPLPESSEDAPRGRCLLSEREVRELTALARRPALLSAGAAISLYFLLLLIHALLRVCLRGRPTSLLERS